MSEAVDTTTHHIGLRFQRSEAGRLRRTADLLRAFDAEAVGLLDKAYAAAVDGAVLQISCADPAEAISIADDFPRLWGLPRPAVEVLTHAA